MSARIATVDCETSPSLAHVWQLWDANVSLSQLRVPTQVISFASKWHDKKPVTFHSDHHDGHEEMVHKAHDVLDKADFVVTYNGDRFDLPHLKREFVEAGLDPPSPFKSIDLYKVVKRNFRFVSHKLQHVTEQLGLSGKLAHTGHQLWVDCLEGDEETRAKAWRLMARYNRQDVRTTEELFDRLTPWIHGLNLGLFSDDDEVCPRCASADLEKRGYAYTPLGAYQQLRCRNCGSWSRSGKRLASVDVRPVAP